MAAFGQQGASAGSDMWSGILGTFNAYTPHGNNCDTATEAFVVIAPAYNLGYCIEKNERAASWWVWARNTCLNTSAPGVPFKRLPEPAEFQWACDQAASLGLNNMTDNNEWVTNFLVSSGSSNGSSYINAPGMGLNGCDHGDADGRVATPQGGNSSLHFRCVH